MSLNMKHNSSVRKKCLNQLGYESYRDYLASEHWQKVKKAFYNSSLCKRFDQNAACDSCERIMARNNLHLHHKTYERLGHERLTDFSLVCENCHSKIHKLFDSSTLSLWDATERILNRRISHKVNSDLLLTRRRLISKINQTSLEQLKKFELLLNNLTPYKTK